MDVVWFWIKIAIAWFLIAAIWEFISETFSKRNAKDSEITPSKMSYRNALETPDPVSYRYSSTYRTKPDKHHSEYRYLNGNASDNLVYLIANETLGVLKIGIGKIGRVRQYFLSSDDWILVGCFDFLDMPDARLAERAVLRFWRHECLQPAMKIQLGSAPLLSSQGTRQVRALRGETETVCIDTVCEHCTIALIKRSAGFVDDFALALKTRSPRKVTCRATSSGDKRIQSALQWTESNKTSKVKSVRPYSSLDEFIESNIQKGGSGPNQCWIWNGASSNGYAYASWGGKLVRVHRYIFQRDNADLDGINLTNICGQRICVNSAHWALLVANEQKICISPDCASDVFKKDLCSACFQRRKRRKAYFEDGTSRCLVKSCYRDVSKLSKHGFCPSCRTIVRANDKSID